MWGERQLDPPSRLPQFCTPSGHYTLLDTLLDLDHLRHRQRRAITPSRWKSREFRGRTSREGTNEKRF